MSQRHRSFVMAIAGVGLTCMLAKPLFNPLPILIWNASDSVPIGWYWVSKRPPNIGEIAVISPPGWVRLYASERGYLPSDAWLLKPVTAIQPALVCRFGRHVLVNGKIVATAKDHDRMHRPLPVWKGCQTLNPTQIFVLGQHRDSFDSRYFGPIDHAQISGTATGISRLSW
jgi:conjugative transfer signal peptidase TraF